MRQFDSRASQDAQRMQHEERGEVVAESGEKVAEDAEAMRNLYDNTYQAPTAEDASAVANLRARIQQEVHNVTSEKTREEQAVRREMDDFASDAKQKEIEQRHNTRQFEKLGTLNNEYDAQSVDTLVRETIDSANLQQEHHDDTRAADSKLQAVMESVRRRVNSALG